MLSFSFTPTSPNRSNWQKATQRAQWFPGAPHPLSGRLVTPFPVTDSDSVRDTMTSFTELGPFFRKPFTSVTLRTTAEQEKSHETADV